MPKNNTRPNPTKDVRCLSDHVDQYQHHQMNNHQIKLSKAIELNIVLHAENKTNLLVFHTDAVM
jgi:hypothetical protein